ncbi:MAG: hypothetical protein COZ06_29850 [Armatimonadetes bacterium CG_4_10_14_3_um_filter_66_18]|nr:DUF512 domain-containing protein [Armatimonadota bacterium]PIU95822.1 MAG: hypothetical protein COS65_00475 [Armatimonadetes bacterium CG06_land_8_20_14_3_00_66_21]PIX47391.1 MAG: hypothetical protein COZ57_08640 [Armatimonadetes bacterium CG_4_8_14_3_um_filter_66_20]PIY39265.1 MAG: hypothetical protein COZ06_29850 [Armatimonadetes bacterium CG_4_10_14_3_um_filter_66_18]PIZ44542.1 MAG: hypothetical protein COY42_13835 [Armatimonadetes bacterium CG_4_10_14_0_8_um_filter_66_14]PJB62306.1 MAG:
MGGVLSARTSSAPGAVVEHVEPGSLAADAGVLPGSRLLRVNGSPPLDVLDYRFAEYDADVELAFLSPAGDELTIDFEKDEGEPLGLTFESPVFDGVRRCNNACTFCFCDQLPKGLRPSLYVRDDDYRLSFLHGTYLTLTNLTEPDFERIARLRLSPLYVSVQAVTPEVRRRLFRGQRSAEVLPQLDRLLAEGIEVHTQVVLVPGVNDGEELERTVAELSSRHPGVASIAVVPVGLTKHRPVSSDIRPVDAELAGDLLDRVECWQRTLSTEHGVRLVHGSDELYLLAGREFPPTDTYDDYPQLENGVGLSRLFLEDLCELHCPDDLAAALARKRLTLATGTASQRLLTAFAERLGDCTGATVRVVAVRNRLLGERVSVAGLLAGRDLIEQLQPCASDLVLIPAACVNDHGLLLDDTTPKQIASTLGVPVIPAGPLPSQALEALGRLSLFRSMHTADSRARSTRDHGGRGRATPAAGDSTAVSRFPAMGVRLLSG